MYTRCQRSIDAALDAKARPSGTAADAPAVPAPPDRRRFRDRLLALVPTPRPRPPWRKTSDPYHILVSEIMLQQTQVDRVLPKYAEWLEKYPSLEALADGAGGAT